ncbi:hypothetical protein RRG08_057585 [Elysia crispata]|uniref:Uncharacterized protein n=1 Tax=Elysia crispata TaxID=231223 RepID=A0AAE0ZD91_9GAST|nr:hypothetical protein RRG08_057585 [Elysia crispata]
MQNTHVAVVSMAWDVSINATVLTRDRAVLSTVEVVRLAVLRDSRAKTVQVRHRHFYKFWPLESVKSKYGTISVNVDTV